MYYDYLIVGAGLYGCVFANEVRKHGHSVLVIDRRDDIAGNVHTSEKRGIQVHDYGAHIFHTSDKHVWDYVCGYVTMNHYVNSPIAFYKNETYNMPFNMNTFNRMWGVRTPDEAQARIREQTREAVRQILSNRRGVSKESISEEDLASFQAVNLEEQGLSLVGHDIFNKLVKGYTEKQWGRSCSELPAFIIKRLPVRLTYDNNYFNDPYQGIPEEGYTELCRRLLEGIPVKTDTAFEDYILMEEALPARSGDEYVSLDGNSFGEIVYTGRIDTFFRSNLGSLEYRSLRFEEEDLPDVDNYQGNAVINYTEREVPFTRIIEHKHFMFGKGEGTVITREYPEVYEEGKEPYYPVNDEKNNELFARYQEKAKRFPHIHFGGRLGQYRYYDMDKVIRAAIDDSHQ